MHTRVRHHPWSDRLRLLGHRALTQLQRASAPATSTGFDAADARITGAVASVRFGALREALHTAPSEEAWREVCALMVVRDPAEAARLRDEWTPYASRALERWPEALRVSTPALVARLLAGEAAPALGLLRWLELSAHDLSPWWSPTRPLPQLERALAHPDLDALHGLRLAEFELDAALIRTLARAPSTRTLHTLQVQRIITPDALGCMGAMPTLRHLQAPGFWGTLDELIALGASCHHLTHITLDTLRVQAATSALPPQTAATTRAPLLIIDELRGTPRALHALLVRAPQLRPRALCVPHLTPDGLLEMRRLGTLDRAPLLRIEHAPDDPHIDEVCRIARHAGVATERVVRDDG